MACALSVMIFLLMQAKSCETRLMLGHPTGIEEELGVAMSISFTFTTQTNQSDFIFSVTHKDIMETVLRFENEKETANVWAKRGHVNIEAKGLNWKVSVTLNSTLVQDDGQYLTEVSSAGEKETGKFHIVTIAQPVWLKIDVTGNIEENEIIDIRCYGNVGRPNPELRLLQTNLVYNETTVIDKYVLPENMIADNGTYDADFTFKLKLTGNDANTKVECEVKHNVWLGKELRSIQSETKLLNFDPSEAALTISAKNKIRFPQEPLVINCKVGTSPTLTSVYVITLNRNTSNTGKEEDWKEIASVNAGGPVISTQEGTQLATRATVTGKLTPVTSAELVLEIKADEVKCTDAASYQCTLLGAKPGDSSYGEKDEKAVAIEVLPSSTNEIDPVPEKSPNVDKLHTYVPGTVVTMTCTGMVGNPAVLHRWCKHGSQDFGFVGVTEQIKQDFSLTYNRDSCSYTRTSQYKYNITNADKEIKFMCEDATNSRCGDGLFTKEITLYNNVDDKTDTGGQTSDDTETASAGGVIAGAVIGSIAGVILIALIIYFLLIRGRNSGETYDTKEDGSPGGPAHTEGPVYSVPDKNRGDRSNRYAHENKGMDEPHETRIRNSPDERGHTNKMMYDDDYDNDLDGNVTKNRGGGHPAEGFGSAV